MDAVVHAQHESTFDLMAEKKRAIVNMRPVHLAESNPQPSGRVTHMHAPVYMCMLSSGVPCPNMHDRCVCQHARVGWTPSYRMAPDPV